MVRATWNGRVIAESEATVRVEGNHYFPPEDVDLTRLLDSPTVTWCFWKGRAQYHHLDVGDEVLPDVAWTYPRPWPLARRIAGHVAFSPAVRIER